MPGRGEYDSLHNGTIKTSGSGLGAFLLKHIKSHE